MSIALPNNSLASSLVFHPYLSADAQAKVNRDKSHVFNHKLITIVSHIAFAILAIAGVVLATHFGAPVLIPIILLIGGSFATITYRKWKNSLSFAQIQSIHSNEIAQKIDEIKAHFLTRFDSIPFLLKKIKINPFTIMYDNPELSQLDPDNLFGPLKYSTGRFLYWSQQAQMHENKISDLETLIQENHEKLDAAETSAEQASELKIFSEVYNVEKHRIEEEFLLPAKLAAAYNLHVLASPKDLRTPQDFGSAVPSSFLDSMTIHDPAKQQYYYFKDTHKPLSKAHLLSNPVHQIAKRIFKDDAIITS